MKSQQATFYWHDYETWGLNPALDRPSQFAGIRTDMDFNLIGEPDMFYCQLSDDYLPSPESVIITQITPQITQTKGLLEYQFASQIHQQFNQVNTCVVGYNSIRFDDEFSRHLFYRNFYDPYEYCWKNSSSRWDIIDLVRATYALRPEGIVWPTNDQGLPTFRLELLTKANGIRHEQAHDATSDVYATIAIAQLIKQKCPKLFDYYFDLRNKNKVKALIDVENRTPLVHVSGMFGAVRANLGLVSPIVWHPINTNAVVVVDLAQDLTPLLTLSAAEIKARLYTKKDKLAGRLPIPLKLIHINKCPFIAVEKVLLPENEQRLGIDRHQCMENWQLLKNNPQIADIVLEVFQQAGEFDHQGNVDAMLYDGFFSVEDKKVFAKIRQSAPEQLVQLNHSVVDKRFQTLFFRYRARNFPETLTMDELSQWEDYKQSIFTPDISRYLLALDSFFDQYREDEKNLKAINNLSDYIRKITVKAVKAIGNK